jgi:hypothetical protein
MTASDKVRHTAAAAFLTGTIITLFANPVAIEALLTFAVIGVVSGVLLAVPAELAGWIAGAILLFGTEWMQSVLVRRGLVFPWYAPVLIAAAFAVFVYYVAQLMKPRSRSVSA